MILETLIVTGVGWIASGSFAVGRRLRNNPKPTLRYNTYGHTIYASKTKREEHLMGTIILQILGPIGLIAQQFLYMGKKQGESDD